MTDAAISDEAGSLAALLAAIAELDDSGADQFNPVRWHYIRAMAERARRQPEPAARAVAARASAALLDYRAELQGARDAALVTLEEITAQYPAATAGAQALFETQQYSGLARLHTRLQRPAKGPALADLASRLRQGPADEPASASLDDFLRRQEQDLVQSLAATSAPAAVSETAAPAELRSSRYFRAALAQHSAEKLVKRVAAEAPADSGPLNPQMLAIRSLQLMHQLSPQYLARLVSYLDTLSWLERAGDPGGN